MFGNRLGWGISVIIAGLMILFVWMIDRASITTPPTSAGLNPAFIEKLVLPVIPPQIVSMDQPCSANSYHQAIDTYLKDASAYRRLLDARKPQDLSSFTAIQKVLDATHCRSTGIFSGRPEAIINYDPDHPQLEALSNLGNILIRHALLNKDTPQLALQYYQAAFSLGAKLFNERLSYAELSTGATLMATSVAAMERLDDVQPQEIEQLAQFRTTLADFTKSVLHPKMQIISAIDQKLVQKHAGDIFLLARDGKDSMWRVEAMLKLGRYRFNAGRASDQRAALRVLTRYADHDSDPVVRLAAQAARDLTLEQYHRLH